MKKLIPIISLLLTIFTLKAEVETDALFCNYGLTPFEGGTYFAQFPYNQFNYGGDLNGDGYPDLVIGGKEIGGDYHSLYIYFGGQLFSGTPDLIINSNNISEKNCKWYTIFDFGERFTYNGDLNGDGFDDLVTSTDNSSGYVYIFYGSSDFDGEVDLILNGADYAYDPINFGFGAWLDISGDINGDGYNDLLVHSQGSSYYWNGQLNLFFGGKNFDAESDWMIRGDSGQVIGQRVTHGDLNNDGYDDIISIEDYQWGSDGKRVVVYSGGETPSTDIVWSYSFDDARYDQFPTIISNCDFNDDNIDDLSLMYESSEYYFIFKHRFFFGKEGNFNLNVDNQKSFDNQYLFSSNFFDYNHDGIGDLIDISLTLNESHQSNQITFGNSNNNFDVSKNIFYKSDDKTITAFKPLGDINGDNSLDFFTIERSNDWEYKVGIYSKVEFVDLIEPILPTNFHLSQNYPNPFNPTTKIEYIIDSNFHTASITILNCKGEQIDKRSISNSKGEFLFSGSELNSGVYFYCLSVDGKILNRKKMILLK